MTIDRPHRRARARRCSLSGAAFGPAVSDQAGEDHRAVPAGGVDRHRRAADRAEAVGAARPAVLHREHRRRRRQSRHGARSPRSPGDGYTILFASSSIVVNPSLYNKMPYDVDKDFIPVTKAGGIAELLAGQSELPGQDDEGADRSASRREPGKYSVALARHRHHAVAVDRDAQARPRARFRHRAVRRRRADDAIAARRPHADRLRRHRQLHER